MSGRRGGRRPKSRALRLLAGNPGKRPLPKHEPTPTIEAPPRPEHLDARARAEWDRLVALLVELRVLSALDRAALAAYCVAWSRWSETEEALASLDIHQLYSETETGYRQSHPLLVIARQAQMDMRAWAVELGITPSSRSRVRAAPKEEPGDPSERFFRPRVVPPAKA